VLYSATEKAWLDRRAVKIAENRGWPLPIARSEAAAEMVECGLESPLLCCRFEPGPSRFRVADYPVIPSLPNSIGPVRID
jgi:hypothetical protein